MSDTVMTMKRPRNNNKISMMKTDTTHVQQILPEPEDRSLWHDPFVHFLLILAAGFIVYFGSINVPFIFDDYACLVDNPVIKSFDCFPDTEKSFGYAINQDLKNNLVLRPAAYFSFAVNYAIHGLDLFGYHIINLLLHIGCGMLVYSFFVQLMLTPAMSDTECNHTATRDDSTSYLPLFAALLFVCHPLQTQAVTYIIQRFVPLATFFYLAALVLYVHFRRASTMSAQVLNYSFSLIAAVLAMESKEIAFTLPVIIALVEFMFFDGNKAARSVRLIPFFLIMVIIPAKLMQLPSPVGPEKTESISSAINLINFAGVSSWDYLMTQFGVITTYIRLLILPIGQNLDYDYPLQQSFFKVEVLFPLVLILMIVGTGVYLLKHSEENRFYKVTAFGIFWFFITLSVESSIVPTADLIFEHRAYLPSVGFILSFLASTAIICNRFTGKSSAQSKIGVVVLLLIVVILSAATIARNELWQDDAAFWSDVTSKSPNKARAYRGLGSALMRQATYVPEHKDGNLIENILLLKAGSEEKLNAAIKALRKSIQLKPDNPKGHISLAAALMLQKNYDEALDSLSAASVLQPNSSIPYEMRGMLFDSKNDYVHARLEYLKAVEIDPLSYTAHMRLADIYTREGNIQAAIKELELVMRIHPDESVRKKLDRLNNR